MIAARHLLIGLPLFAFLAAVAVVSFPETGETEPLRRRLQQGQQQYPPQNQQQQYPQQQQQQQQQQYPQQQQQQQYPQQQQQQYSQQKQQHPQQQQQSQQQQQQQQQYPQQQQQQQQQPQPQQVAQQPNQQTAQEKPQQVAQQPQQAESGSTPGRPKALKYNLPGSAAEWCSPPILPPLKYDQCKDTSMVNSVPLYGGLTNSLKMVLLGTILSFEEDRCFFVDESESELNHRGDGQDLGSFIDRYFEPIGLPASSPVVQQAKSNNKIALRDWKVVWEEVRNRRMYGSTTNIESLRYPNIEGHQLKRTMLRRMWRPLPHIREETCTGLAGHVQGDEFMTFSLRRGDKASEENFAFASVQQYIDMAEQAIPSHFGGKVPTIFVATDDCTAMKEFREMRPAWRFVSECDKQEAEAAGHAGFALADMKAWSQADTDAHYAKFFIEMTAMATAKYFIGVWYTNVSWWAQFMRDPDRTTFLMLDTPGTTDFALDWN